MPPSLATADGKGRSHVSAAMLAVFLTVMFAWVCIGLSWYMILVKSRKVRASTVAVLYFLEGCSIVFAFVAHSTQIHYLLTSRPSLMLTKASRRMLDVVTGMPAVSGYTARSSENDVKAAMLADFGGADTLEMPMDGGRVQSSHTGGAAGSIETRERGPRARKGEHNSGTPSSQEEKQRPASSPSPPIIAAEPTRRQLWVLCLLPFPVLLGLHVIVHRTIEAHHRQSQEIILALVRCSVDVAALLILTCVSVTRALHMSSVKSRRAQFMWGAARKSIIFGAVTLVVLTVFWSIRSLRATDALSHLRLCMLDDHECDPCEAEGQQLNPMLRHSWVWPAITHRRLFTFYMGSESCRTKGWRPIAFLDESTETLVVSSTCWDGRPPVIHLHHPENNELTGEDELFIVEVISGNKKYHRDLEELYGTPEKARAHGVIVRRDKSTNLILSVEIDPSTLHARTRDAVSVEEASQRSKWPGKEVFEVPLGASATYIVRCPFMNHEEYFVYPLKSKFQLEKHSDPECRGAAREEDENYDPVRKEPAANVLIVLFDAVSRQGVRRALPQFSAWLNDFNRRHKDGEGGGHMVVEASGVTTLGLSTAGNLAPMMAGTTTRAVEKGKGWVVDSLGGLVHTAAKHKHGDTVHTSFTTGYCHDFAEIILGGREYSGGHGSTLQGIDHYLYQPFCHLEYSGLQSNFQGPYSITRRCIDNRHVHEYMFDYTEYLLKRQMRQRAKILQWENRTNCRTDRYQPGKYFFDLSYFVDGHEGTHTAITLMDDDFVKFMNHLEKEIGFFNDPLNTLIFAGDHGNHMGHYYEFTHAGHFERTTPPLAFLIHPEVFARIDAQKGRLSGESMTNFLTRTKRVSTPLDVYRTIGDLLNAPVTPPEEYMRAPMPPLSLFDTRAGPPLRRCKDFSRANESYICASHFCVSKEDADAVVTSVGDL